MGVSAIVGLGNTLHIYEDDLLTFFEQNDGTYIIAPHCKDLQDGRAFAEAAQARPTELPVQVLGARYRWERGAGLIQ